MTSLTRWEPSRDLVSLRQAMDRLFEESFVRPWGGWMAPAAEATLAVDVYTTDENVVVKATIPGVKPEDIDVSIAGDTLNIRGETKAKEEVAEGRYVRRECRYGAFSRSLVLPTSVVAAKAEAEFENGILTLTIPKAEEVKPKVIKVKAR